MKLRNTLLFSMTSLLLAVFVLQGCSNTSSESKEETKELTESDGEPKNFQDALNKAGKELDELFNEKSDGESEEIVVVNFRELQDMLPNRIGSLKMDDSEGQTSGMMGFNFSQAKGSYSDGDGNIDINIMDLGKAGRLIDMMVPWSKMEMDKESKDGYEKTTTYEGYKAFEKYDSRRESGSFAVLVEGRFFVTVEGDNIRMKDLKRAIDEIGINKLKRKAS